VVALPNLIAAAEKVKCAKAVAIPSSDATSEVVSRLKVGVISDYRPAPAEDQKRQLKDTPAARLHLSPAQATKVNAWLFGDFEKAQSFLLPSQRFQMNQR
jgi:hypothetical protein